MQDLRLIIPSAEHEADAFAFADEVYGADGDGIHGSMELTSDNPYSAWLDRVRRCAKGETVGWFSPADTYFAVIDGEIAGILNIRHTLDSEFMQMYGGHIGYTVRPKWRGKGAGTQMLRLALEKCNALGISRPLVTVDPENTASCKVIEKCGGVFESDIPFKDTGETVRRYLLDAISPPCSSRCQAASKESASEYTP